MKLAVLSVKWCETDTSTEMVLLGRIAKDGSFCKTSGKFFTAVDVLVCFGTEFRSHCIEGLDAILLADRQ